jgi:hypothetical protein
MSVIEAGLENKSYVLLIKQNSHSTMRVAITNNGITD